MIFYANSSDPNFWRPEEPNFKREKYHLPITGWLISVLDIVDGSQLGGHLGSRNGKHTVKVTKILRRKYLAVDDSALLNHKFNILFNKLHL